jgi:uridine kinase
VTVHVVGVAGGSGSGKTSLADDLRAALGERCVVLAHDAYYRPLPDAWRARADDWNFDTPDAIDTALLVRHLGALRAGRDIEVPTYAFEVHDRVGSRTVSGAPIVVVEGVLLLAEPALVAALDLRVFVDTPEDVRLQRRLTRDVEHRGRTPESVRVRFDRWVRPMHARHVEPSRRYADLVLDGRDPRDANVARVLARLPLPLG